MKPENDDRLRLPLDDEEPELMDPETWDWDSDEELSPAPHPSGVLPIRFSLEEMTRVGRAADAERLTIYEYVKQSTLMRVMQYVPKVTHTTEAGIAARHALRKPFASVRSRAWQRGDDDLSFRRRKPTVVSHRINGD